MLGNHSANLALLHLPDSEELTFECEPSNFSLSAGQSTMDVELKVFDADSEAVFSTTVLVSKAPVIEALTPSSFAYFPSQGLAPTRISI